MIRSLAILIAFHTAGSVISTLLLPVIPGNVIGLVLLAVALAAGLVRLRWVEPAADLLVDNLAFLFVPAGVGVMAYTDLIARDWLPISISVLVSLVLVLVVTGRVTQAVARLVERGRGTGGKKEAGAREGDDG